jgi:hypothetical protein
MKYWYQYQVPVNMIYRYQYLISLYCKHKEYVYDIVINMIYDIFPILIL